MNFTPLGQTRGVRQGLADVLFFKIRKVGQEVANATPSGYRLDDHADGNAHAADTRLTAHDRRINGNSSKFEHVIIIAHKATEKAWHNADVRQCNDCPGL